MTTTTTTDVHETYAAHRARVTVLRAEIQRAYDTRRAQGFSREEAVRQLALPLRAAARARVLRDACLLEAAAARTAERALSAP